MSNAAVPISLSSPNSKTILWIDDDQELTSIAIGWLSRVGYRVIVATDGIQALAVVRQRKPSLILLDLQMPRMNGMGFLSQASRERLLDGVPVIVVTGFATWESLQECRSLGVSDALIKPFDCDKFLKKVEENTIRQFVTKGLEVPEPKPTPQSEEQKQLAFQRRMNPSEFKPQLLADVVSRATDVSTLPQIALKVAELVRSPNTKIPEIVELIKSDPALATRVLRLVNSAAYSLVKRIHSLHEAISYLGFNQLRDLVMSVSVSKVFRQGEQIGPYSRYHLWRHSVTVAICTQMIVRDCQVSNSDEAFLSGLLHDLGIVLEDQYDHSNFQKMILKLQPGDPLIEAEKLTLGYDHTFLGGQVAKQWGLPEIIRQVIRFHHSSQLYDGDGADLVRTVEAANFICTAKGVSSLGFKLTRPAAEVFRLIDIGKEGLIRLMEGLDEECARHQNLFELI